ncbi:hypothetical protein [Neomoorella humiferrea]|uniref:hypothetical protein n=1 Tax=Neomoorella humiferrea TaxID=676965 RepID=UPI0030CDE2C9
MIWECYRVGLAAHTVRVMEITVIWLSQQLLAAHNAAFLPHTRNAGQYALGTVLG